MSTVVPVDALCHVTQCYHYTPECLSLTGGQFYICRFPKFSITSGQRTKRDWKCKWQLNLHW